MDPCTHTTLLHAGLDAFAVVGGTTAGASGLFGALALLTGAPRERIDEALANGVAVGGLWGVPSALAVLILELAGLIG
ncbi:MAG TPA: hypothetical protein VGO48_15725 [Conexibacter sp.]|jgi:hypothetical protein|nr:hypothetical protein [Conexibacter sp.]